MISGTTALFGVVGHPVAHSLSPAMHNAAFAALGLNAAYVALPVPSDRLEEALRGAHALGFQGLSVTVPHKKRTAALCLGLDGTAEACGAVNTLRRTSRGWEGYNTDAPACRALMVAAGLTKGSRALLLGAGGAAHGAAWALLSAGVEVAVAARRTPEAEALCLRMARAFPGARVEPAPWAEAMMWSEAASTIVNATSIGLDGNGDALPTLHLHPGQVAVDFVYGDTPFARRAAAEGAKVVTGEEILLGQGTLAFTLWTGKPAPEPVMAEALRTAARDG